MHSKLRDDSIFGGLDKHKREADKWGLCKERAIHRGHFGSVGIAQEPNIYMQH